MTMILSTTAIAQAAYHYREHFDSIGVDWRTVARNTIQHFDRKGQGQACGDGWISARKKCSKKSKQKLAQKLKSGDKKALGRAKRSLELKKARKALSKQVEADKGKKARDLPGGGKKKLSGAEEFARDQKAAERDMGRIKGKLSDRDAEAIDKMAEGLRKGAPARRAQEARRIEGVKRAEDRDKAIRKAGFKEPEWAAEYNGSPALKAGGSDLIAVPANGKKSASRFAVIDPKKNEQIATLSKKEVRGWLTKNARSEVADKIDNIQSQKTPTNPARPKTAADQDARNAAIASFTPQKRRSRNPKPKGQKELTTKNVDITQPDQRREFAQQQLKQARKAGDKKAAKKWEAERKKASVAAVDAERKRVNSSQGELFGVETGSSLPLFAQQPEPKKARKKKRKDSLSTRFDRLLKGGKATKTSLKKRNCTDRSSSCGDSCISLKKECNKGGLGNAQERLKKLRKGAADDLQVQRAKKGILKRTGERRQAIDQKRISSLKKRVKEQALGSVGKSSGLAELDPSTIAVDPKRFQYKITGEQTKSGEVGSLRGVQKYDPNLGGILQVWKDPGDGKTYVVNGHNRLALAKRLGADNVAVRYLDSPTPKAARAVGALTNIAEGRGNAMDAAKFFRDSGISREDLEKKGIPMQEKIATDGLALSRLDDSLFRKTIDGELSVNRAAIIGGSGLSGAKQRDLNKLIQSRSKRNALTDDAVKELADIAKSSETQTTQTLDLFGTSTTETSTVMEKARLQAGIKRRLSREKKLFGTVSRGQASEELKRGGNSINRERSGDLAQQASQALGTFDQMKNLSGPVSSLLNQAAGRVAAGENLKKVEKDIYSEVLEEIKRLNSLGKRSSPRAA